MQLYGLSPHPVEAARALCNQHVNSQARETMQILITLLWHWGVVPAGPVDAGEFGPLDVYAPTHKDHPCVKWAAACRAHAMWTYRHAKALCGEFTRRHKGLAKHLCEHHIDHWYAHVETHGFPADMPETIAAEAWIAQPANRSLAWRVADINPPHGCAFGIVALDMIGPRLGLYNDWTASYHQYYLFKRDFSFKRPMGWGLYLTNKPIATPRSAPKSSANRKRKAVLRDTNAIDDDAPSPPDTTP